MISPAGPITATISPDRVGRLLIEYLRSRGQRQRSGPPENFVEAVAAEYYRLGTSAVRKLRAWRILRAAVLVLVAPIAPLALTDYAWISAVLAGLVTVIEGSLAIWNLSDTARAELETANRLETELLLFSHGLAPYDAPTEDGRMTVFVQSVATLKTGLSATYLSAIDSSFAAGSRQAEEARGAAGKGKPAPLEAPADAKQE